MRFKKHLPAVLAAIACASSIPAQVSQTPPMGFNSYDCLNFSATESEMKAIADTMAKKYLPYGWHYVCIDWCWSFPGMGSQGQPNQTFINGAPTAATRLTMDAYGRLMPDTLRHPSAGGGKGFKPLADYIHGKGLKFGIHVMRGIPRQAVWARTPVYGTSYVARDAADTVTNCAWLNHMFGLNMTSPAAQAYLNSILALYASWGVDYIKVDDLMNSNISPRTAFKTQIQGYRTAIDSTHRDIVFSTSPGATPIGDSAFMKTYVNQWRMADDLWDNWPTLNTMIDLCAQWYPVASAGHFPDADMIPIGYLSERGPVGAARWSGLTRNEQFTLMTMWIIARSPLIWGGDLRNNRAVEDSLMTNAEVLAVNQRGIGQRPLVVSANYPIWSSNHPDSPNVKYVALFNRTGATATVTLALSSLGMTSCTARNLWSKTNLGPFTASFGQSLPAHAAGLYKLTVPTLSVRDIPPGAGMASLSHRTMVVAGNRFVVPPEYRNASVMIQMYDVHGRLIAAQTTGDCVAAVNNKASPAAEGLYIVRIKPLHNQHLPEHYAGAP